MKSGGSPFPHGRRVQDGPPQHPRVRDGVSGQVLAGEHRCHPGHLGVRLGRAQAHGAERGLWEKEETSCCAPKKAERSFSTGLPAGCPAVGWLPRMNAPVCPSQGG